MPILDALLEPIYTRIFSEFLELAVPLITIYYDFIEDVFSNWLLAFRSFDLTGAPVWSDLSLTNLFGTFGL